MAPGGVLYVIAVFGAGDEFGDTVSAVSKFFDGLTMKRWIEAEVVLDLGQAEEDQREQLALGDLEVEQPAELLHDLARGEHLGLVDQDHGLLALLEDAD